MQQKPTLDRWKQHTSQSKERTRCFCWMSASGSPKWRSTCNVKWIQLNQRTNSG